MNLITDQLTIITPLTTLYSSCSYSTPPPVFSDAVPLTLSRQLIEQFATTGLPQLQPELQKASATYALERLQPRAVSYEEQATILREALSSLYESSEDWNKAAQALSGIDLDSSVRQINPEYKLAKCVKIAMLYLEDDDAVNAESFIKKASSLLSSCRNQELELQYKSCYARVSDSKRKFLEAAQRYYELSQVGGSTKMVDESDLEQALHAAVTCAILGAAGPQRSRILATLYKDERTAHLKVRPLLEKVYLERLLGREEVEAFAAGLAPHQLAILPDGSTVLQRSVTEHNVEAVSKIYTSISIAELASLLGVTLGKAELITSSMVTEGRLHAEIDQVEGLIIFKDAAGSLESWDVNIATLCQAVNSTLERAAAKGLPV
jgi:COP9 signalosome complex subunit 4